MTIFNVKLNIKQTISLLIITLAFWSFSMACSKQTGPPTGDLDASKDYSAVLYTENGNITIDLFEDKVPLTVENFINLSKSGYYNNVGFHRIIPGFMAQTGDPTGTGSGGPGYSFEDEFHPDLVHKGEGIVSMANRGPNTNGSQFFITYASTPHLDGKHSIFGKVTSGMQIVTLLAPRDPRNAAAPLYKIDKIEIIEK
jgi:cyclophilin family peptidyl-prolyl cis-trans isomerase